MTAPTTSAPKIVHMHIPKTAGTSVNGAFFALYGKARICPARYEPDFKDVDLDGYDFFTGHIGYDVASKLGPPVVCLLRDPIDRFISVYYYWRQLYEKENRRDWGVRTAYALSLDEFVERFDEVALIEEFFNRITWQFAHSFHMSARRARIDVTRAELLKRAQDNMAKCAVVGRQEDMPRFVADCRERLGITLNVGRYNVTSRRADYDSVPLSVRRRIATWVELDLELYWSLTNRHTEPASQPLAEPQNLVSIADPA